jgi:hypothetical protein
MKTINGVDGVNGEAGMGINSIQKKHKLETR